jgi:hypothetical protein
MRQMVGCCVSTTGLSSLLVQQVVMQAVLMQKMATSTQIHVFLFFIYFALNYACKVTKLFGLFVLF